MLGREGEDKVIYFSSLAKLGVLPGIRLSKWTATPWRLPDYCAALSPMLMPRCALQLTRAHQNLYKQFNSL